MKYDVAIIGSGLGGLLCGYILSKQGYNVCILEKNNKIGGCLQTFQHEGCTFDTGIHYIGSLDEGQILNRYFRYFELTGKLHLKKLDTAGFDNISFEGNETIYPYAMGMDNFATTLSSYFPKEQEAIKQYCDKITKIALDFPLYNLRVPTKKDDEISYFSENTYDFIKSTTQNTLLQNVLAGTNFNYAGVKETTPLYVHALITHSFINSAWKLVNGGSEMATLLSESIKSFGGTILTNSCVIKLSAQNEQLTFADLSHGERIEAKSFISDIRPSTTLELVEGLPVRKAYKKRIADIKNTTGSFTVYIIFKENAFKYLNANYIHYARDDVWTASNNDNWPNSFLFLTQPTKSGAYADSAILNTYMDYYDLTKWENTFSGKRGEDYEEFKQLKALQLLEFAERRFPGLRNAVKSFYTSTPLTYRDYTGTPFGSMYGISRDSNNPMKTIIPPKSKIPGLYFTGQNIILHGVLGVTIGAVNTCAEFTGLEYLVNKINY